MVFSVREKENMTHRDRDSDEAPLMRPNNSGIKKKSSCGGGAGGKEGEKNQNKAAQYIKGKK